MTWVERRIDRTKPWPEGWEQLRETIKESVDAFNKLMHSEKFSFGQIPSGSLLIRETDPMGHPGIEISVSRHQGENATHRITSTASSKTLLIAPIDASGQPRFLTEEGPALDVDGASEFLLGDYLFPESPASRR